MAFAIAAGRHPKFPTHQPITKSMYFRPRESVTMLPLVAAICSSAGCSLARGSRRRAGRSDPFCALWRRRHCGTNASRNSQALSIAEPLAVLSKMHQTSSAAGSRRAVVASAARYWVSYLDQYVRGEPCSRK